MNDSSLLLKKQKKRALKKMNETYTRKKTKSIFSKKNLKTKKCPYLI